MKKILKLVSNTRNFFLTVKTIKELIIKNKRNVFDFTGIWLESVLENNNIIGLNKGGKNITLEPGNQIELSGDKLTNIHEACAESYDYLFELKQVTKKLKIKIVSAGFDPISKLNEIPDNPKKRYTN